MSARSCSLGLAILLFVASLPRIVVAEEPLGPRAPNDTIALVLIDADALQKKKELKPVAEFLENISHHIPIHPLSITEMQFAICPRAEGDRNHEPVLPCIVFRFRDAASARKLVESTEGLVPMEHGGKTFLSSPTPRYPSIYHIDERTLVLSFDRVIKNFIDDSTPPAEIREPLERATMKGEIRGVFLPQSTAEAIEKFPPAQTPFTPPALKKLLSVPKHVTTLAGRVNLASDQVLRLEFDTNGDEGAKEVHDRLDAFLIFLRETVEDIALPLLEKQPVPEDLKKLAKPFSDETLGKAKVSREGQRVVVSMPATADAASMAATALPIVAKELEKSFEEAMQLSNRFRLQSVSHHMLAYLKKNNHFPDDICDRTGKPLMSWRCELVQDQQEYLFRETPLDNSLPWNAEPNRSLLVKANYPFVLSEGRKVQGIGLTTIFRFTGKDTLFHAGKPVGEADVKDGPSKTILLVMTSPAKGIPWAQPGDLAFDAKNPIAALGEIRGDTFLALFCDGSVRKIPKAIKPADLKALITPAGGEEVDETKLETVFRPQDF